MLKSGYKKHKHAGQVVYENKERETYLKSGDEGKEHYGHSQKIKFNNFAVSRLGQEKGGSYGNNKY